jgi:hypothetical protein
MYTFGVGRENMNKMFVEDIKKHGDKSLPGPGKYSPEKLFGSEGIMFGMRERLPSEQ